MKKIINPIPISLIEKEINKDTFVRKTNYCNHEIYIIDYHNHINTTMEIGRLRELSFKNSNKYHLSCCCQFLRLGHFFLR